MKLKCKRIGSLLLALCMLMTMLPVQVAAAVDGTFTDNGLEYKVLTEDGDAKTGTVALTGYEGSKPSGSFTVTDAVYNGGITYTVTEIGDGAFEYCDFVNLTIPDSVEDIGDEAFADCEELASLSLGSSVRTIGESAFAYCGKLESVTIPASVEAIGNDAFNQCGSLTAFTAASDNPNFSAEGGVLYDKSGETLVIYPPGKADTSFSIPALVKTIGAYAFARCDNLESITIGGSVETIGESSFAYCENLESVTIGSSVKVIGEKAFSNCYSLESVIFEANSSLETIGDGAFGYCISLISLTLPDSLESIGASAFGYCDSLESINIPASVNTIGDQAFYVIPKLATITVAPDNGYFSAEDNVLYDKAKTLLIRYLPGKTDTSFSVPASVVTIGEGAFYACGDIEAVTIPASVNTIGDAAFYWASGLEEISFLGVDPPSSISDDDSTFSNTDLTAIYVPAGSVDAYKAALPDYADKVQAALLSATGTMDIGGETEKNLASNQSGTGWTWDAASATLTLNSSYTGEPIAIDCQYTDAINLIYTGDVSISSSAASSIFCRGSLNITGSGGTLTLNSAGSDSAYCAIDVYSGALTIGGSADVNATCAGSGTSPAAVVIYGMKGVTVSGSADVTADATGADASGIWVEWGDITISTTGTVTANGNGTGGALAMWNIRKLNMSGGTLTLTGNPLVGHRADLNITGGSITIGGTPVYRALLTLSGVSEPAQVTSISSPASGYGVSSDYTSDDGSLCFLLPAGSRIVTLTADGKTYTGTVNVTTDHAAAATLTYAPGVTVYPITVNSGTADPAEAAADTTVTITANAAPSGQRFKEWTVVSGGVTLANANAASTTFTMPANPVEVTATYEDIPAGVRPVTGITLNRTSASLYRNATPNTVTLTATVAPADATDKTVTWRSSNTAVAAVDASGKVTAAGNGTAVITATTTDGGYTASCTVTVTTYSSGGDKDGGSSGNDRSRGGSTASAAGTAVTDGGGTVTATASVDGSGNASAAVTQAQISNAIAKASEAAAKSGRPAMVEIKVKAPADAKTVETTIPQASIRELARGKVEALTINTPAAEITFDAEALSAISERAAGEVKITVARADASSLSEADRQKIGDRPVLDFSVKSGDKEITQFRGTATVSVPYTPKPGEDINAIVIYYIDAKGEAEAVAGCWYDPATGRVIFETDHFSTYAVGYNKISFRDVEQASPYAEAVTFIAARGITGGTGNGNFSPGEGLTRGEFLVMLMRACNIAPDRDISENFADAGNTWYTGYLAAAKRLGISEGVGANSFAPERKITNQELYTMLYNSLEAMNRLPEAASGKTLTAYSDSGEVASWASTAMSHFAKADILAGSGGKLSPAAAATRAEMARIMYSLLSK